MLSQERINEIKEKTKNILKEFWRDLNFIAKKHNISLNEWDLDELNVKWLSGFIQKESNWGYVIVVNKNDIKTRKRFTVAHELWHFFLHKDILEEKNLIIDEKWNSYLFREIDFSCVPEDIRIMEEEANEFAWNLLMPEEVVKIAWNETKDIKVLAEFFMVSVAAMSYRIYKLNLE